MALDNVSDRINEIFSKITGRIQESSAWNQITEKYNSLSPIAQKLSLIGASFLVILILLAIPGTFYFSSQSNLSEYEDRQALIHQLFHVTHAAAALPPSPANISSLDLQAQARNSLSAAHLLPEQIISVTDFTASIAGVPKTLEQAGAIISLAKLNLKQMVDIGSDLQLIHPMARLIGVEVKALPKDTHRFDVTYKLVAYSPHIEGTSRAPVKRGNSLPPPPIENLKKKPTSKPGEA
jgi:hypothetical protein